MSAISLRHIKRDFSQLNYQPDIEDSKLIVELTKILKTAGLLPEYNNYLHELNTHMLIKIVKHICQLYYAKKFDEELVTSFLKFLAKIYTKYCIDETVKRAVIKCIKSCPENWQPDLATAILHQLLEFLDYHVNNICEAEYFIKILNDSCEFYPNIIHNSIEKFLAFLILYLNNSHNIFLEESSPPQKVSAIRYIHEGFRFFLATYKREILPDKISFIKELNTCFIDILGNDNLPMETLFNCCLSILYLNLKYISSAFDCWKMSIDLIINHSDLVKLGFCIAVLNSFTSKDLQIVDIDTKKPICVDLYNIIKDVSFNNLNDSCIIIASSRALLVYSKRLCTGDKIELEEHHLADLFDFIWLRMDHFLDSVRHLARDTMINIIKISDGSISVQVLEKLSVCDQNSKAFFTVFTLMSDKVELGLIMKYLPNLAENLLNLMSSNNLAITVFIHLMTIHYNDIENDQWFDYWLHPLLQNPEKLDVKHFEQIITKAIELSPNVSKHISDLSNQNDLPLNISLIYLKIEKNKYLANNDNDNDNDNVMNGSWLNETNMEILKKALHSNNEKIRFIALNLILDCHRKTQPLTKYELDLIQYFIIYNVKHDQPSIRQTNLSFIKKALLRMKESMFSAAVRNNESLRATITYDYQEFQHWFSEYCFKNLFSDASFSRRNFALESLCLIQTYLIPIGIIGLLKSKNITLLLNCLWDTYEQNKKLAKDIIIKETKSTIKLDATEIENLNTKSKKLVSTTSPPDCITAGYLLEIVIFFHKNPDFDIYTYVIILELMTILNKEYLSARESLTLASANGPMYGAIHALRHILNTVDWKKCNFHSYWFSCLQELIDFSFKCTKLVSSVISDSSPEGIIPMDDLHQKDYQVTSQMVLLCCWRTAKESSLMLSDIGCIIADKQTEFNDTLLTEIFSFLTLILSESKHRGAFEQIYVAYLKMCTVMWKSPTLHKIPQKYLENVLTEIKLGLNEIYCVTRRSAGMPFIIQALISSVHDKRKVVNYTMETLIEICENKNLTENVEVGVVHALNVLRALFRCSQLGDVVGAYVSKAFEISIELFNSSSWPIRNSSTLLLSALVNRVFGVLRSSTELSWKNRMTGREFFERYPKLFEIFLNEFKKFSPLDMSPSLYPTLLILARLYPSVTETTDCVIQLADYIPYIYKCAQSPVMKTRMLSATAIASQVTQIKLVQHLTITFHELINTNLNENTKHGLLIQIFTLVENLPKLEPDDLSRLLTLTEYLAMKYYRFNNCSYMVKEIFLRCITTLWLQLDALPYNSIEPIYELTLDTITKQIQPNDIGKSKYLESATLFLFSISLKTDTDFSIIAYKIIKSEMHCKTIYKILSIILSGKPIKFYGNVEKCVNPKYWNHERLMNQLLANNSLIELVCQQCTIKDSLIHKKYLVLSKFTPALNEYFKVHESIDDFISNVFHLRRDVEISKALLCIDGYLQTLNSFEQSVTTKLTQVFENIYSAQRSDDCKIACIDIIVNNYKLLIENEMLDHKMFLKLWMILINYSEDNSEEVRSHVWCLVNKNTNCTKSFELLFDKFAEHNNLFPCAVFTALTCWSYFGIETPKERLDGQVFDSGDTSKYKEITTRNGLAIKLLRKLTNTKPQLLDLEMNKNVLEWINEEWPLELVDKKETEVFKTVENFMFYAKQYYLRMKIFK